MVFPLIIGALASVGSAIVGAVASVGAAVSSFSASIAPTLGSILTTLKTYAEPLAQFANTFLRLVGILEPHEKIEDIGDRALQGVDQGVTLDKFEKFNDYMNALRNIKLDSNASEKNDFATKLITGLGLATVGLEDKFHAQRGSFNSLWLLPLLNPVYFTPERMQGWISAGKLGGDIMAYLDRTSSDVESRRFEKQFETNDKGQHLNNFEIKDFHNAVDNARENWANISEKIKNNQI